jgi:hypothetical protein
MEKEMEINKIIDDREATHGAFSDTAQVSQRLKSALRFAGDSDGYNNLSDIQKEALDMICSKISRIINGNANEVDHWVDVAGYSMLVAKAIEKSILGK